MRKFHRLTSYFTTRIEDRIVAVNDSGRNIEIIQQIETGKFPGIPKNVVPFGNCYRNFPNVTSNKIMKVMESNGPIFFTVLQDRGGSLLEDSIKMIMWIPVLFENLTLLLI